LKVAQLAAVTFVLVHDVIPRDEDDDDINNNNKKKETDGQPRGE
jgi:hypothetical protein